ncbi:dihydropteroate synthase [Furfurilactobacillus rossiae]|uniref:Dihydropteroate synthase n=1 Tax=Furfurilactobacillus rossiae DSM 15814 TaxID=1114972 RepID=A0A0R1RKE0_9LACO|nr:dihydropteroate synthase [Furfurilactobacillus rossiae]KRL57455.1 dihydropteroate synthase [Furfurilactobacillus rossiae DSM 15814]QFR65680.1 dihydropteroate synthase [Furfurilactobacillus rossiae]QLE61073.1 Dihydropteroate synthase [Furfurilactobacillus rossiae]
MKVTEINANDLSQTNGLAEAALLDAIKHQRQLALMFEFDNADNRTRLVNLMGNLDAVVTVAGNNVQTLISEAALPVLEQQLSRQFDNNVLAKGVGTIRQQHEIHWQAGRFDFNVTAKPLIYGILNVSPDSFYDGGRYHDMDSVLKRAGEFAQAGVPVVEIGGQTTRPHFTEITPETEIQRVMPYIKAIKAQYPDLGIAVDTYKLPVMKAVLDEGVDIINDVNAFTDNSDKLPLLASSNVGLLTMHESRAREYDNLTTAMTDFFKTNLDALKHAGINEQRIALDEGIGYAKVADGYQDFTMMRNINQFLPFERPIMIAISRKGFGHKLFGLAKEDRLSVTLIAEAYMYLHGGRILRVHDIEETKQLVTLLDTIEGSYWFPDRTEMHQ